MTIGFQTPIDICNRGLGHCGSIRIDPTVGFNENSKRAAACAFVYDKLRRAELRRNVWRFAIRKACLRPVFTTTMFLSPSLWSANTTYYLGSVVSDQSGSTWISNAPDNLNNLPANSSQWDPYYGSLAVNLFDGTVAYFAGELVYNAPGDGTYKVFMSLQSNNSDNPLVPELWTPTATYIKDQLTAFAAAWSSLTTYAAGQCASFTDGNTYVSLVAGNLNNTPGASTKWIAFPAPVVNAAATILEWNATTTYGLGSFVDVNGTQYVSLVATNLNLPPAANPSSWAALSALVVYGSLIDANTNNEPDLAPALWASGTTYAANAKVGGSDGVIYSSVGSGNVGHNPVGDTGVHWTNTGVLNPWSSVNLAGSGSLKWLLLPSPLLVEQNFPYPIGGGPAEQSSTRNIYRLPANYLRTAPQDPKAGGSSFLGAPSNLMYDDWEYEGNFIVTRQVDPIIFRFVADVVDVTTMDDMFCEGLGARIGLEVCEELTQSTGKKQAIASEYSKFMGDARTVNAIEEGPTEAPLDDLIACRL